MTIHAETNSASTTPAVDRAVEGNQRFRAVFDAITGAMIVIDAHGAIEMFNPAAERMFGYTAGQAIGRNVSMLMPEPYRGEHDSYLERYIKTGEAKIIGIGRELVARREDGSLFPIDLTVTETRMCEERKFVGIVRDITERKAAQSLIAEQSRALLELSTPVVRAWDEVVLLPLIGVIDSARAQQIIENLLEVVDSFLARVLNDTAHMVRVLGTQAVLCGMQPSVALTLVEMGRELLGVATALNLDQAMDMIERASGHDQATFSGPTP